MAGGARRKQLDAMSEEKLIDAHHHLWRYHDAEYPWMREDMGVLRRDYLLRDLEVVARADGVTGTVAVQARQKIEETEWLSSIASGTDLILGVVGWVPLIDPAIESYVAHSASLPKVKGMRHVLHDEPDPLYMSRMDFDCGISLLKLFNLTFDLLIFESHLPQTIALVDRHPNQVFIVDHIAKPKIREGSFRLWKQNLSELALRTNVFCKLSGMVTEAGWTTWSERDLLPYFETVMEVFGCRRIMFGSDWPVVALAASYSQWLGVVRRAVASFSADERRWIFGDTAAAAYGL